jgi:hypothetical protein
VAARRWPRFGAAINPGQFSDIVTGVQSKTNYLVYVMANQRIYRPDAGSDRGLDVNFAFDWTPGQFTQTVVNGHRRGW